MRSGGPASGNDGVRAASLSGLVVARGVDGSPGREPRGEGPGEVLGAFIGSPGVGGAGRATGPPNTGHYPSARDAIKEESLFDVREVDKIARRRSIVSPNEPPLWPGLRTKVLNTSSGWARGSWCGGKENPEE